MRFILWISLLSVIRAEGQIPRNSSGLFEYSYEVTVTPASAAFVKERAKTFFNQPFLVHWDTIATGSHNGNPVVMGKGYVSVRAKYHSIAIPKNVTIGMQMSIEAKDGGYHFVINHFTVNNKFNFALEQKPDEVKSLMYDQLLQKTRKRVSFLIGWLKRYMEGQTLE